MSQDGFADLSEVQQAVRRSSAEQMFLERVGLFGRLSFWMHLVRVD